MKRGRWFEQPEVLDYIVQCYVGVEGGRRQFIWEQDNQVLIGNTRAFTDHVAEKFDLDRTETSWSGVHELLRALGEVVHAYTQRQFVRGGKFKNQEPDVRVLRSK